MFRHIALSLLAFGLLRAQELDKLPDWAVAHARAATAEPAPSEDPDSWVVFDRTEVAYGGDNEIWTHRYRLVKVLGERGISEGVFRIMGVGGKANKVKKLKGWNLRPDNELVKLDQDSVVTLEDAGAETFSRSTLTAAILPRVAKGSWVAFESLQVAKLPFGPIDGSAVMGRQPIRRWEMEVGMRGGWFFNPKPVEIKLDLHHFSPYLTEVQSEPGKRVTVFHVPALPNGEAGLPPLANLLPIVVVRFLDPALKDAPIWPTWDAPASWFSKAYASKIHPSGGLPKWTPDLGGLLELWRWMGKELSYKAVYLTPERGWIPEDSMEVFRKRYGDCKDLSSFFLGEASALGFKGAPALACIIDGRAEATSEPMNGFNHVIAALQLEQSLGFPAEVETPKGRFLLVDATDPLTPLGQLPSAHRGGQVLICLPEGGIWTGIPEKAIFPGQMEVTLDAEVRTDGGLEGNLAFRERGNAWGLRSAAKLGGKSAVRDRLLSQLLDLPPTAQLEIQTLGDPGTLETPFEVGVKVRHPRGFRLQGGEASLEPMAWRIVPPIIQKPGQPRFFPVESAYSEDLHYRAKVKVPFQVLPILPEAQGRTPFRSYTWKARGSAIGEGTLLELELDHRLVPATFGHEHRDEGIREWKRDRSVAKNLVADALAFKIQR
ncbi:MAG TPA: hypothetical protein VJ623_13715 [Holophagaceae bacterium]|nr:hypothetical protein [Holophagaceae bacterium]